MNAIPDPAIGAHVDCSEGHRHGFCCLEYFGIVDHKCVLVVFDTIPEEIKLGAIQADKLRLIRYRSADLIAEVDVGSELNPNSIGGNAGMRCSVLSTASGFFIGRRNLAIVCERLL